ncbi:MAG: lipid A biosynthesis acyltransferase, partial [Burkholderiaceae bacterium]|nr:lipid A biosynthesis acyltransferase [Burkholderiaceae bacterium]
MVLLMRALGWLPLSWLRALGWLLGQILYALVPSRRKVVTANLALCFAQLGAPQRRAMVRRVFVRFAQAWLDRGWLWHASAPVLGRRLRLNGAVSELTGQGPTVIFAPHFVGLDAGWTALTLAVPRHFTTIYTDQADKVFDAWILQGRRRFGGCELFGRADGVKPIVASLREGAVLYLLPDMNFGPEESIFVP